MERVRNADTRVRRLKEISARAARITRQLDPPLRYTKKEADEMFSYLDAESVLTARKSKNKS